MTKHVTPDGFETAPYSVRPPAHPLITNLTPSEVEPHIDALEQAGIYDKLTPDQQAIIIRLMQSAYRKGQADQHAEKIDNDAVWVVWVDGIGGIEKQPDGTWKLTMPDKGVDKSAAAATLGSVKSERKAKTSAENGRKGGRPRKQE